MLRPATPLKTRMLLAGLAALIALLVPLSLFASDACLKRDRDDVLHRGGQVEHPNLPHGGSVWAGTFCAFIDLNGPFQTYCIDLNTNLCYPACYTQGPDITATEIVWILHNYYPEVPSEPSSLSSFRDRARAVQLAIWHFSDGLDVSSGGTPTAVFDAARAIIAAAQTAPIPQTPTTVTVTPSSDVCPPGEEVTITVCVLDQNGDPIEGQEVDIEVTGTHPRTTTLVTDENGKASFAYTGTTPGTDTIRARAEYTIPIGLRFVRDGCQSMIMAEDAPGKEKGRTDKEWDVSLPVEDTSWGQIKVRFVDP